jgi:hypothetical protein
LDAISISDWGNYLAVQGEAAATLTGLVFVAVSINLTRVLSIPGLTGRAAESLTQLFGVLIVSTTALIPRQSTVALGVEILALGSALWFLQTWLQVRYMTSKTGHPRHWAITRVVQTQFATIPLGICGALLLNGSPAGLYWLAPGLMLSLVAGVASAWVLLVEILR